MLLDIDSEEDPELLYNHGIQGFPTIKLCMNGVCMIFQNV